MVMISWGTNQTCSTGALSSINGAARLMKDASPTPTSLHDITHIVTQNVDGIKSK